jgi:hypothetical protein
MPWVSSSRGAGSRTRSRPTRSQARAGVRRAPARLSARRCSVEVEGGVTTARAVRSPVLRRGFGAAVSPGRTRAVLLGVLLVTPLAASNGGYWPTAWNWSALAFLCRGGSAHRSCARSRPTGGRDARRSPRAARLTGASTAWSSASARVCSRLNASRLRWLGCCGGAARP